MSTKKKGKKQAKSKKGSKTVEKDRKDRFQGKIVTIGEKRVLEDLKKLTDGKKIEFTTKDGNVIKLYLSGMGLTKLPESIGDLISLKRLDVGSNEISALPESIGKLKALEFLRLARNTFSTLPKSIGHLKSLRELDLTDTALRTFPESFRNLVNLEELILRRHWHGLPTFPEWFGQLSNLKRLLIGEYLVKDFPKKLAAQLKANGCRIQYESRDWIGGPGGYRETVKHDFFSENGV